MKKELMNLKMKRSYEITVVSETELEQMERIRDLLNGKFEKVGFCDKKRKF